MKLNFDRFDLKVYDTEDGFITRYAENKYVEKTEVHGADIEIPAPGSITVYMRSRESYTFPCWASSVYCGQYGINVSADGERIYVISDIKGLWCYSKSGDVLWKTRYTAAEHVFANPDGTVTCTTSTAIIMLDENGKPIKKQKIMPFSSEKISKNMIFAYVSERTVAFFRADTMESVEKIPLNKIWQGCDCDKVFLLDDKIILDCCNARTTRKKFLFDRETKEVREIESWEAGKMIKEWRKKNENNGS
ncbi:MAG: hypothetical protein IJW21_03765 [Clostridia bacterium]|nr:hypothetical protein [Clostridia bacterium]